MKGAVVLNFSDVEAPSDEKATDKIGMRVRPSDKARMLRAAELSGAKLSTFIRTSAAREAERILREHRTTTLSGRDRRALLKALDNPPAPTAAARDAVRDYRSQIANAG